MSPLATSAFVSGLAGTARDVLPIILILGVFQFGILRRPLARPGRVAAGFALVLVGLTLFVVGLEEALFPLGRSMAEQLTDPAFVAGSAAGGDIPWWRYYWVYLFAASIGFAAVVAEPALIAVALKAQEVSGGAIGASMLRLVVALGVALSVALSSLRIITGVPLYVFMVVGYAIVIAQTWFAPKEIVPLAYDSGGVSTSTVTVPLVTALGLGLASSVPGRSELTDGFGVIALAALFPMIAVMGYAQVSAFLAQRSRPSPLPGRQRGGAST